MFVGFPSGNHEFTDEEVGGVIGGMLVRDVNGIPLPGILPSKSALITPGAGWTLNVGRFVAVRADGTRALVGASSTNQSVTVVPSPSANSRIDVVYTRPPNFSAGDLAGPLFVVTGVPGASPVKPSIPPQAVEIGTFTVQSSASSAAGGTIENTFTETAAAGGVIRFRDASTRDTFMAVDGQLAVVGSDYFRRSGSAWLPLISPPKAGRLSKSTGPLTTVGSSLMYIANVPVAVPYVCASDEAIVITALDVGNSFGIISQAGTTVAGGITTVMIRFTQTGNISPQTLRLLWQVVKVTS